MYTVFQEQTAGGFLAQIAPFSNACFDSSFLDFDRACKALHF